MEKSAPKPYGALFSALLAAMITPAIIYGCASAGTNAGTAVKEEHFNYTLLFCDYENCLQRLAGLLMTAKESVRCALYRIDGSVIGNVSGLATAEIVVDEKAKAATAEFSDVAIYKSKSRGIMHNKYCIIDGNAVATGSFNPTAAAIRDYNDMLVVNSTNLATFYRENFERLKESSLQKTTASATAITAAAAKNSAKNAEHKTKAAILNGTSLEVYFCPEDDCAEAVKEKIREANSSIVFAVYSFTHPEIANELILKAAEGTAVAGVIEKSTTGSEYSKHDVLAANGVDIELETSKRLMHHKFFVVDNETVITGSFNPTKNADERNDENIIIIRNKELARAYAEELNKIKRS